MASAYIKENDGSITIYEISRTDEIAEVFDELDAKSAIYGYDLENDANVHIIGRMIGLVEDQDLKEERAEMAYQESIDSLFDTYDGDGYRREDYLEAAHGYDFGDGKEWPDEDSYQIKSIGSAEELKEEFRERGIVFDDDRVSFVIMDKSGEIHEGETTYREFKEYQDSGYKIQTFDKNDYADFVRAVRDVKGEAISNSDIDSIERIEDIEMIDKGTISFLVGIYQDEMEFMVAECFPVTGLSEEEIEGLEIVLNERYLKPVQIFHINSGEITELTKDMPDDIKGTKEEIKYILSNYENYDIGDYFKLADDDLSKDNIKQMIVEEKEALEERYDKICSIIEKLDTKEDDAVTKEENDDIGDDWNGDSDNWEDEDDDGWDDKVD